MHLFFLQAGISSPPPSGVGVPVAAGLFILIPVVIMLIGMSLGLAALNDIRTAGGRLGGAMTATLAAGILPAIIIVIVCGGGLVMLIEEIMPRSRARSDLWPFLGSAVGVWLSFLMMRRMYRSATGWSRTAGSRVASTRSPLVTVATVLTVIGAALFLMLLILTPRTMISAVGVHSYIIVLDLAVLVGGLVCGVLGRAESGGRACTWICGILFVVVLLMVAA